MWFIVILIATVLGGPESAIKLDVPIPTQQACEGEKARVWAQLDAAYPLEEHGLYRLKCIFIPVKA
jgi:hypothetical protein